MKQMIILLAVFSLTVSLFAGGEAETGRNQALSELESGQLLPMGAVDPANYLQDFDFEIENNSTFPVLFRVDLLKKTILERGDTVSLRIALVTNQESFFTPVPGNYILFFQNPELLRNEEVKMFLTEQLPDTAQLNYFLFDPVKNEMLPIGSSAEKPA